MFDLPVFSLTKQLAVAGMNASHNAQYFFGPDMMVAPITAPAGEAKGDPSQTLATKETWLPMGTWFDTLTGKVTTVAAEAGALFSRGYTLGEIPAWFKVRGPPTSWTILR